MTTTSSDFQVSTKNDLLDRVIHVRERSEQICQPLKVEDYSVQPIVDVSPPKWHLAHSTWFFEQFVLTVYMNGYKLFNKDFAYLFNSYYNNVGERVLRPNRGLMTRPTVKEVIEYRHYVTEHLKEFMEGNIEREVIDLIEIGLNHEEQHQELLAYDIKYILGHQPTFPSFENTFVINENNTPINFITVNEGVYTIGHQKSGFCFDNELGVHKVYLSPFQIANRLVTNGEYLEFIEAKGYQDFNLWHSDAWAYINENNIVAPLYWHKTNEWQCYDFEGLNPINLNLPVMNISYYEASAYAEWKGLRLPTEFEWEVASPQFEWGELWEWTGSAYLPYPYFKKASGAIGEYNGKFMVNQHVLRGASFATPPQHSRSTYRNFFHPHLQWMFSGIRLAK